MNSEDMIIYLTALVAVGVVVVGLLTTVFQNSTNFPVGRTFFFFFDVFAFAMGCLLFFTP